MLMQKNNELLLLILILFMVLFTLTGGVLAAEDSTTDQLVYVNFRDIRDLNPHLYSGELFAQNLLFEGLVKITDDGIEPWLAKDWEISDDGRTYTFYLREDVSFSDGYKFDAQAVEANIQAIYNNYDRHGWLESIRLLEEFSAVDDYIFRIKLEEAYYPLLTELAVTRPFRFISPAAFIDGETKNGVKAYIGTGKYVLAENHVDQYAVFKSNHSYWGKDARIEKIIVKVIPDNQIRTMALENGEIDLIYGSNMIDADTYQRFFAKKGFNVSLSDPVSTRMLVLNSTDKILSDRRVRQAINAAVNREEISEGIFYGLEVPATRLLAKTVPYCDVKLDDYNYSLEKAKKLLKKAGWKLTETSSIRSKNGQRLEIDLNYNADDVTEKMLSEYIQAEMKKIGINLKIKGEEEQSYRDRTKSGNFSIIFNTSWGTPYDPHSFFGGMRMPAVHGNYAAQQGLEDVETLHNTILKAFITTDEEQRQEYYNYILKDLHQEAIYVPLTFKRNRAIYNEKVKNVEFNPSQYEVPMDRMYIQ